MLAVVGAPTTLPMWLRSLQPLPAAAGGSGGEATNGPVSQPPMPMDPGVSPWSGTSIAATAEQQPWPRGVARGAQPGAPVPCGRGRCHRVSCWGTVAVGATPPAVPESVNRPGSGHPQTRLEPLRRSQPHAGASSVHPAGPCVGKSPSSTHCVSAVAGPGSPFHGAPSPRMHPVPPAEREALSPSSAHRSGAAR